MKTVLRPLFNEFCVILCFSNTCGFFNVILIQRSFFEKNNSTLMRSFISFFSQSALFFDFFDLNSNSLTDLFCLFANYALNFAFFCRKWPQILDQNSIWSTYWSIFVISLVKSGQFDGK